MKFQSLNLNEFNIFDEFDFTSCYKRKILYIPNKQLAYFNFKILHNILPCGKMLCKWKKLVTEKCASCGSEHTVEHMLFSCPSIRFIWTLTEIYYLDIKWHDIVLGRENSQIFNFVSSIIAFCLFKNGL